LKGGKIHLLGAKKLEKNQKEANPAEILKLPAEPRRDQKKKNRRRR